MNPNQLLLLIEKSPIIIIENGCTDQDDELHKRMSVEIAFDVYSCNVCFLGVAGQFRGYIRTAESLFICILYFFLADA